MSSAFLSTTRSCGAPRPNSGRSVSKELNPRITEPETRKIPTRRYVEIFIMPSRTDWGHGREGGLSRGMRFLPRTRTGVGFEERGGERDFDSRAGRDCASRLRERLGPVRSEGQGAERNSP